MANQPITRMSRIEKKFLLPKTQAQRLKDVLQPYITPDTYHFSTIRNVYYDTDSFELIRKSIEKPAFKEKLRLRSYSLQPETSDVFLELKRKCKGVVYKRRESMPLTLATGFLSHPEDYAQDDQVLREIAYLLSIYDLAPKVALNYERHAYKGIQQPDLRVTFDTRLAFQTDDPSLTARDWGREVLPEGTTIMEVKCTGAMPLWLARTLSAHEVFPTSFSKYGYVYSRYIAKEISWNSLPSFQAASPSRPSSPLPRHRSSSASALRC